MTKNAVRIWDVEIEVSSEKCPHRYQYWRPPIDKFFCDLTNKSCLYKKCAKKSQKS